LAVLFLPVLLVPAFMPGSVHCRLDLVPAFMPGGVLCRLKPHWLWLAVGGQFLDLVTLALGVFPAC